MNPIAMSIKLVLAVAALALAWVQLWAAQVALGFMRDEALAVSLASLAVAGIVGVVGMALGRRWGPALIGVQAAGFFILVQVFGHFSDTEWTLGLIAMLLVSVALTIWHPAVFPAQPE